MLKEKDLAEQKASKLAKQLEKLKNAPKPVKIDLTSTSHNPLLTEDSIDFRNLKNLKQEISQLSEDNDKLQELVKKLKRENGDL